MFGRGKRNRAGIDDHRGAMMMTLMAERGWAGDSAALATLAVHPLDDTVEPSRAFEDLVRARSARVAFEIGAHTSEEKVREMSVDALRYYKDTAEKKGEAHYATRYDSALETS